MNPGIVGGIVGSLVGIAGGLIGSYFSVKNTQGPRERTFVIRCAIACWIGVSLFLAALLLLPQARSWIWILYTILLLLAIVTEIASSLRYDGRSGRMPDCHHS